MALLGFEQDLIDEWRQLEGGSIRLEGRTGRWIKAYLERFGEGYCYEAWRQHQRFIVEATADGIKGLRSSTYNQFRTYWGELSRDGLIIPVRREPSSSWMERVYYSVNPVISDGLWDNPRRVD